MSDIASIERRLQALEDHLAINQIVSGYGYAVDSLSGDVVADLYAPDGVYAVTGVPPYVGRETIAAIVEIPQHVAMVGKGCAHVATLPYVVLDGDRASATCHFWIVRHLDDGYDVFRLAASRLELSRKPSGGWQIDHRQNHQLNGGTEGPAVLGRLMEGPAG